ncbi:MAG: glycosyltransferase family 4 protein [Chthoniobacteraceae bacterium]
MGAVMTVVFAAYHDFHSNSSIQIFSLANRMVEFGHRVHICVPAGKETATLPGEPHFACCTYGEALNRPDQFTREPGGTVIHAWTPREGVRKFTGRLRDALGCQLVVHLEDNEDIVTSAILGRDRDELLALADEELDAAIPDSLSHPRRFRAFLESASGVTFLIDRLSEFVPADKPQLMFWPAHNDRIFREMPLQLGKRRSLGIADHEMVVAYVGNVTPANRDEVASLYLAVAILRRMGHPVWLVRTGTDFTPLFEGAPGEISAAVISLGQLQSHTEIPEVLGMADFLVQPGRANDYNDYRFPSKLPEFFSIGRPVLLPYSNIGRFVRDGVDAVVLREGHAMEIADRLAELIADPEKRVRLSRGALAFCREHFDWKKAAAAVTDFYGKVCASSRMAEKAT